MEDNLDNILVFATNIKTAHDKAQIHPSLDTHSAILSRTIDQQDRDCVLRVVTNDLSAGDVITLITNHNYHCTELE